MFECFFPDAYMDSTYVIDFEKLYKEGIRGVIFDIDNTLCPMEPRRMSGRSGFLRAFAPSDWITA